MKRAVWKWTFWISVVLLVLLMLFTVGIWALGNATAAIAGGIMESIDPDNFGYQYFFLDEFVVNAIGSPMFYIYLADLAVMLSSIVAMILTRKQKVNHTAE